MLQGVNVGRGLVRLWAALTGLWILFIGALVWNQVSIGTSGPYQYAIEERDGVGYPFSPANRAKTFNDLWRKPSETKFPPSFYTIDYQYRKGFDDSVSSGAMVIDEFPDGSKLYINANFPESERKIADNWFWEDRWRRRLHSTMQQGSLFEIALLPPTFVLVLGLLGRWVLSGFRPA